MQLQGWLDLICQMVPGVDQAVLVEEGASACHVAASWPEPCSDQEELISAAEMAVLQRKAIISAASFLTGSSDPTSTIIAYPLAVTESAHAAIALRVELKPTQQTAIMQMLAWGEAWLQLLYASDVSNDSEPVAVDGYQALLHAFEQVRKHSDPDTSATAVATSLARDMGAERVSLGMLQGNRIRIRGVSHSSSFDPRVAGILALESVMLECCQRKEAILCSGEDKADQASPAHQQLAEREARSAVCSVPLKDGDAVVGVLLFEFANDAAELRLCQTLGVLLGSPFAQQERRQRPLWKKLLSPATDSVRGSLLKGGTRSVALIFLLLGCAGLLAMMKGTYRVAAPASLEGRVQQAVVAPYEGYVAESYHRAGEVIAAGETIAELETREMLLEQQHLIGEKEQHDKQYRQSLARLEKARAHIYQAKIDQTETQLRLLEKKIQRARLVSPLDGIIITGDLSRALGAPVAQGDLLFEVAPLDEYRLVLQVQEEDIAEVRSGLEGELTLKALPDRSIRFRIDKVSPVFEEHAEGIHYRVEALFETRHPELRPGMQGVARIIIGARSYGWIYLHRLIDAVRLWMWSWLP